MPVVSIHLPFTLTASKREASQLNSNALMKMDILIPFKFASVTDGIRLSPSYNLTARNY